MTAPKLDIQLRKDTLILRAALERVELKRAVQELQRSFAMPAALRSLLRQFTRAGAWPLVFKWFQRYPIVGSALTMLTSRAIPRSVRGALRAVGYGVVAWQLMRWVRAWRPNRRALSKHTDVPPAI